MPKLIKLEQWEIDLILNTLAELPYKQSGATIRRIEAQLGDPCDHSECYFCPFPCERHGNGKEDKP